jgi:hypothetical protein
MEKQNNKIINMFNKVIHINKKEIKRDQPQNLNLNHLYINLIKTHIIRINRAKSE